MMYGQKNIKLQINRFGGLITNSLTLYGLFAK